MYQGEKRICEFGDRPFVIIQSEEEKVKNMEKYEGSLCELWDSSKWNYLCIIADSFSNLGREVDLKVHEAHNSQFNDSM